MNNNEKEIFTRGIDIGNIFFSGIGGIGMSAIATILHRLGYKIQGSDASANANTERLKQLGIKIFIGQKAENLDEAALLVRSSAIKEDHPEILAARAKSLPILGRGEMLAEIMKHKKCVTISGTHGKTTTTSMMDSLFAKNLPGTTVINGGILNSCDSNAFYGDGDWLVAEADESDGSFLLLPAQVAVVTNIAPEHLDHYGSFAKLKSSFKEFIHKVPKDGFAVCCYDREEVRELISEVKDVKVLSYGFTEGADIRAVDIKQTEAGAVFAVELNQNGKSEIYAKMTLPIFGKHNIQNALAVIAVGIGLDFAKEKIIAAISEYKGVKRRLTVTGVVNDITIIDDYAHHPEEVSASLQAITEMRVSKANKGRIIAVLQPHRYSRLQSLFAEFASCLQDADLTFICDVYAAGEKEIPGINKENLAAEMKKFSKEVHLIADLENLAAALKDYLKKDDIVICLGAGSISKYANELPEKLKTLFK